MMPDNCTRCGHCCQLVVPVTDKEIKRIRRLGYSEDDFIEKNVHGNQALKLINNYCVFLEIKQGKSKCKVYENRPQRCRDYPGKDRCTLKKHFTFEEND